MDKIIQQKITRFIELSKLFSKKQEELFEDISVSGAVTCSDISLNSLRITSNTNWDLSNLGFKGKEVELTEDGFLKVKDNKTLTKGEEIRLEAEIKAQLSDKFDEYKELQTSLDKFFIELNNITK